MKDSSETHYSVSVDSFGYIYIFVFLSLIVPVFYLGLQNNI